MGQLQMGDPEELSIRGRYAGAQALGGPEGPVSAAPVPAPTMEAPEADARALGSSLAPAPPTAMVAQGPSARSMSPGGPTGQSVSAAPPQPQSEYPDWMTDDDKRFAEMARQAARNYQGRVQQRRENRALLSQYGKLSRERDVARGRMEDIASVLKSTPELFMEEDGKTYNQQGMALIRQLAKHREAFKRIKEKEASFLKTMGGKGMPIPQGKDELGDEDLAQLQSYDDNGFDEMVERGFANALAFRDE